MNRSPKPPELSSVPDSVLFNLKLPPILRDTLCQLLALQGRSTSYVTFEQLSRITGKSVKTLYHHLARLRDQYHALQWQTTDDGRVRIYFAAWVCLPEGAFEVPAAFEEESGGIGSSQCSFCGFSYPRRADE